MPKKPADFGRLQKSGGLTEHVHFKSENGELSAQNKHHSTSEATVVWKKLRAAYTHVWESVWKSAMGSSYLY